MAQSTPKHPLLLHSL